MKSVLRKIWDSPTLNTWLSFFIKSSTFILVLPLVISKLPAEMVNVWGLFITIITLQNLVDVGFGVTFIRAFSYAKQGVGDFTDNSKKDNSHKVDFKKDELIGKVLGTMNRIYRNLFFILILILATAGTYMLYRPISLTNQVEESWYTWLVIIFTSSFGLFARKYVNILLGFNLVALQKRVESLVNATGVLISVTIFYFTSSIFLFILFSQISLIINFFILRKIVINQEQLKLLDIEQIQYSRDIFKQIWPSVWKSTVGTLFSTGIIQSSGIIYAQYATAYDSAVYLLYLRIITAVAIFSTAPFYSKIPLLSALRAKGQNNKLIASAQLFMLRAHWVFVISFIIMDIFGFPIFNFLGKEISFHDNGLFYLLAIAFFAERYGAMHIQLLSTTNKIIWHIANGASGIIIISSMLILNRFIGVYAFPISFIIGNVFVYAPISAYYSYNMSKLNFIKFEKKAFLAPALVLGLFLLYINLIANDI